MAIAHIELVTVVARSQAGVTAADAIPRASETKTLSGSSQATTMTGALGEIWVVSVSGDCLLIFGSSPTALAAGGTTHHFIPAGGSREFNVSAASQKLAVISPA